MVVRHRLKALRFSIAMVIATLIVKVSNTRIDVVRNCGVYGGWFEGCSPWFRPLWRLSGGSSFLRASRRFSHPHPHDSGVTSNKKIFAHSGTTVSTIRDNRRGLTPIDASGGLDELVAATSWMDRARPRGYCWYSREIDRRKVVPLSTHRSTGLLERPPTDRR